MNLLEVFIILSSVVGSVLFSGRTGHRLSDYRHYDADCTGLLRVGGVSP